MIKKNRVPIIIGVEILLMEVPSHIQILLGGPSNLGAHIESMRNIVEANKLQKSKPP